MITNLRMELFQALVPAVHPHPDAVPPLPGQRVHHVVLPARVRARHADDLHLQGGVRCEGAPVAATCMSRGRVLLSRPPTGSMLQEMSARPGPGHTQPALSRVLSVMIVCLKMTAFRQPSPSSSRYQ